MAVEGTFDTEFRALAQELKQSLTVIARYSEVANSPDDIKRIQTIAEQNLRIVDSFLLISQAEYGQQQLTIEPMTIGSVLYDAIAFSKRNSPQVSVELHDHIHDPIVGHKRSLVAMVSLLIALVTNLGQEHIQLRSLRSKNGQLSFGVFGTQKISEQQFKKGVLLSGKAHTPMQKYHGRGIEAPLSIVHSFARITGSELSTKRCGKLYGVVMSLQSSEQLALV